MSIRSMQKGRLHPQRWAYRRYFRGCRISWIVLLIRRRREQEPVIRHQSEGDQVASGLIFGRDELRCDLDLSTRFTKSSHENTIPEFIGRQLHCGRGPVKLRTCVGDLKGCKDYAMTGWRIGFAFGPAELIKGLLRIHQYTIMSAPTTAQAAALEALRTGRSYVDDMRQPNTTGGAS